MAMLFNSFGFIFLFLPVTLFGFHLTNRTGRAMRITDPPEYYKELIKNYDNILGFLWEEDFYLPGNFFDHAYLNRRGSDNYTADLYKKVKMIIGI